MVEFSKEKVKGLMAEKGYKMIDVAEALNISYSSMQNKLSGKNDFSLEEIKQLARTFDVVFTISKEV